MNTEQRLAALEQDIKLLREVIAALTGGQQAPLCGLQTVITESHPAVRSATMQRLLDESGDALQALPVADAVLDETEAGRQAIGGVIHAAFLRAQLSAPGGQGS